MNFEELYKKPVISLSNAAELGIVDGIYLDKDTSLFAALSVGGLALTPKNIVGKEGFITVCGDDALAQPGENHIRLSYGQKALTYSGKILGEVTGIVTGRKYVKLIIGESQIPTCRIQTASEGYLIVKLRSEKKQDIYAEAYLTDNKDTEKKDMDSQNSVSPFPQETRFEELTIPAAPSSQITDTIAPPDYSFLLGRKVEREISDLTHTFFISPGTIISESILALARKAGKIVDLAINSAKI